MAGNVMEQTSLPLIQTPWSDGANGFVSRLDYSHAYYQIHFDYTREVLGDDRVIHADQIPDDGLGDVAEHRFRFSLFQTGLAAWVGDQDATFEGLTWALNSMFHSHDMGYLSFGLDIGGYRENDSFTPEGRTKNSLSVGRSWALSADLFHWTVVVSTVRGCLIRKLKTSTKTSFKSDTTCFLT